MGSGYNGACFSGVDVCGVRVMILDVISWIGSSIIGSATTLIIGWKTLKSSKEHLLFGAARDSFLNTQQIINSKKVEAAETLWENTLGVRRSFPPIVEEMDFFTEAGYENMYGRSFYTDFKALGRGEFISAMETCYKAIEKIRLYIDPDLLQIYLSYYRITLAISNLLVDGTDNAEKVRWYEDEKIRDTIKNELGQEVLDEIDQLESGKLYWMQGEFELKIRSPLKKLIAGEEFEKESLEHAARLQRKIVQMRLNSRDP